MVLATPGRPPLAPEIRSHLAVVVVHEETLGLIVLFRDAGNPMAGGRDERRVVPLGDECAIDAELREAHFVSWELGVEPARVSCGPTRGGVGGRTLGGIAAHDEPTGGHLQHSRRAGRYRQKRGLEQDRQQHTCYHPRVSAAVKAIAEFALVAALVSPITAVAQPIERLVQPGPWDSVSGLVAYGERVWLVNSVKFIDHNSADVYSYDPQRRRVRYERHLFSQDAGTPAVAGGLLYWPFEDPRFSIGRGEYMVTDGTRWRWAILPTGEVFHVHAIAASQSALYAATSAWRAGIQRSDDGGATWRVVYDHPTPPGLVSRITALAVMDGIVYAALSAPEDGAKLLRLAGDGVRSVATWPSGSAVDALTTYHGHVYAVNVDPAGTAVWQTDGHRTERITALDGHRVRAFAADQNHLWAVTAREGGGALWCSADGRTWTRAHAFDGDEPMDVAVYAGRPYVGTRAPGRPGALWGPPAPAPVEPPARRHPLPSPSTRTVDLPATLARLERALIDPGAYERHASGLRAALEPLALAGLPEVGELISRRLEGPFANGTVRLFGGALREPAAKVARWHLLWALAAIGRGRVPPALLAAPWGAATNRPEKYLEPAPAAAWAAAAVGQDDEATLATLIARLGAPGQPGWLDGDFVGALTALTGKRFGYDLDAWRVWWAQHRAASSVPMVRVPRGELLMGSEAGEQAEAPVHRVTVAMFSIDRFEVTNDQFAAFVRATGHVTDPERTGIGWHWVGTWREVRGAEWRHPRGPDSTIDGLDRHPVVQISWNDAAAYCQWRGARLPTEAEWERAARGAGDRVYPWGDESPRDRASYGSDTCCRADDGDGFLYTAPVGSFPRGRSPFGVDDLAGNVWEWVEDWFDATFYARSPTLDPVNRVEASRKVIRGGGWGNDAVGLRSTLRHANPPDIGLSMVGFRCADDAAD